MTEPKTVGRKPSTRRRRPAHPADKNQKHAQKRPKNTTTTEIIIKTQIKIGAALRALPNGVSVFGLVITMGYYAGGFPGIFKLCVYVCLIYFCFFLFGAPKNVLQLTWFFVQLFIRILPFKKRNKFHSRLGRSLCYLSNIMLVQYVIE